MTSSINRVSISSPSLSRRARLHRALCGVIYTSITRRRRIIHVKVSVRSPGTERPRPTGYRRRGRIFRSAAEGHCGARRARRRMKHYGMKRYFPEHWRSMECLAGQLRSGHSGQEDRPWLAPPPTADPAMHLRLDSCVRGTPQGQSSKGRREGP